MTKELRMRKRAALDDLRKVVECYEVFVPRRVFYDCRMDSFRYIGKAHDYTSAM